MARLSAEELLACLSRDLPHALSGAAPQNGQDEAAEATPKARGEKAPLNLLKTRDVVVRAESIPDVARYVRDELGYQLLSTITAVDYLAYGVIEVVYHFVHLDGGPSIVIKTRVPRDQPVVPSITPFWPGADLQEREAYDLFGVVFPGHPNLRRVYMWDEFEGFPMRRDFPKQGDKYFGGDEE